MKKLIVFPYKMGSESAKVLARDLNTKRVYPDGNYRYFSNHHIINWGNSTLPQWNRQDVKWINHPSAVARATNKLNTLRKLEDNFLPCPMFFTNKEDLIHYTEDLCETFPTVYCRTTLTGHSGSGIVLAHSLEELVPAPLYTIRFKAQKEYRVHTAFGQVIDFAKKSRRNGPDERASGLIRNYDSGWIFKREGIELTTLVKETAIKAVAALGLDFGAVDIAETRDQRQVCIYEVNTACGMQEDSTTLQNYVTAFKRYLNNA